MHIHGKSAADVSPAEALQYLKEGNFRFVTAIHQPRDLLDQVDKTKEGQSPFAVIVSCMDSRTSVELIFDQGFGAVFSIRNAGNVVSDTVLGSLEYATAVAGAKLIVIMGHSGCGAVRGAIDGVQLGHLTGLLGRIAPAVQAQQRAWRQAGSVEHDGAFVEGVTVRNVCQGVDRVLARSDVIRSLLRDGRLDIVPAVHDIATGRVRFYERADPE